MDISTAQQILVVVLATVLAIFLVLSVVAAILVIRLLATLRMIASKAEHIVESVESVGEVFKNAAGPLGVLKFIRGIVKTVHKDTEDKGK